MGTWGVKTFENDTAADWAYDLEESEDLSVISRSLAAVLETGEEELDADVACEGLAACEVVALLIGRADGNSPSMETVDEWVEAHQSLDAGSLLSQAVDVIERILTPPSELLALWEESGADDWRQEVLRLRSRLSD